MLPSMSSNYVVEVRSRLTSEQHAALGVAARRAGVPLAVYVRMAVLEKLARDGIDPERETGR
jgi:predicted HicB family RNase H-like nuclease